MSENAEPAAEPEWLPRLRESMHEISVEALTQSRYGAGFDERARTMADAFVEVAAAYVRPLCDKVEALELEEQSLTASLRDATNETNAFREQSARLEATIAAQAEEIQRAADIAGGFDADRARFAARVSQLESANTALHQAVEDAATRAAVLDRVDQRAEVKAATYVARIHELEADVTALGGDQDHQPEDTDDWVADLKARMGALEDERGKVHRFAATRVALRMLREAQETARAAIIDRGCLAARVAELEGVQARADAAASAYVARIQELVRENGDLAIQLQETKADRDDVKDRAEQEESRRLDAEEAHAKLVKARMDGASPETREVPVTDLDQLRNGDRLSGTWSDRATPGTWGMPFAEADTGWLINPVVTRPVEPLTEPTEDERECKEERWEAGLRAAANEALTNVCKTLAADAARTSPHHCLGEVGEGHSCDNCSGIDPSTCINYPRPEMREVPESEGADLWQMTVARDVLADLLRDEMAITSKLTAELERLRPATPLPNVAGSVGTATIRGEVKGVRVHRIPDHADRGRPWVCFHGGVKSRHADSDLSDYVVLLDGEEGDRG